MWERRCFWAAVAVGFVRIAFYYLLYEPSKVPAVADVSAAYEPLKRITAGAPEIGYVSDQPLDEDPFAPRRFDAGDMMYARAQYALAPTLLSRSPAKSGLVLANCSDADAVDGFLASGRYSLVDRPAPNVALLRAR